MVMKSMRQNMKPVLWVTAIIFISVTFIGLVSLLFKKDKDIVAQINSKKIKTKDFYKTFYDQINTYRYHYQMNITEEMIPQLKRSVLEGMIQFELLSQEIKKQGIKISNQELIDQIRQDPSFQKNDKFNQQLYLEKLKYQGINPQIYENKIRNSLKNEKIRRLITAGVKVPMDEIRKEYKSRDYDPKKEADTFEKRRETINNSLASQEKNRYFQEWFNYIKIKATIANNLAQIDPGVK